ncbi:MAG: TIGR03016 family PEP-CTERM system-associated outer membrane protein [Rhodanobacter sp.]
MRTLSASVVLSSIVLGSWLPGANAQVAGVDTPPTLGVPPYEASDAADDVPPGFVPQPSLEFPGVTAGITLGQMYTDNLTLAARGRPKESSWITQIQPFIKSAYNGPRLSGLLNYTLTGYLYPGESRRNQLAQRLDARGTLTVLPQHLFVDGSALYGREVIDNELPSGSGTFFLDGNRANVSRGTLSPYWTQNLGNFAAMMLRYSYSRVMYDTKGISGQSRGSLSGIPDITSNGVQFNLVSPQYNKWSWNFNYSDQRIERDFGPSARFAVAKLGTALKISDNTRLIADGGRENNFLADGTVDTLGASFWEVGIERSSARNRVKAMVGHRFYGRSYQFSWTRTAALLTTSVSYVEQPTDLNQQLLGGGIGAIPSLGASAIPSLRQQRVYLMKRASGSVSYEMPTSTLRLALYDERRTYFLFNDGQERVSNANVSWLFNVGPSTTVTPTYGWQRYQHQDGQANFKQYAQLAVMHQFDPSNFGSLRLRHDTRNVQSAVADARDYGVNVIFVQFTHLF